MSLESWVKTAREQGASDLHLEPGLPMALRVRGQLRMLREPVPGAAIAQAARALMNDEQWDAFGQRLSFDLSRPIGGVRCRVNVMRTSRGIGLAVRLLASFTATLRKLNLHPELATIVQPTHGLVLVSGPTGSGKSSTLAALLQEVNVNEFRHIVTIESPIEYVLVPRRSLIRQREVGRDTPSFEQALIDAMREDPDVLMVGEMRDPETMRLTLAAAETGHLVLATLHSSSAGEALCRIVSAFPAEAQSGVASQLADALVAVVCQHLRFRTQGDQLVPELEVLRATNAARNLIRQQAFSKIPTLLESGGQDGHWTFSRYREWLASRRDLYAPADAGSDLAPDEPPPIEEALPPPLPARSGATQPLPRAPVRSAGPHPPLPRPPVPRVQPARDPDDPPPLGHVIEIDDDADPATILRGLR